MEACVRLVAALTVCVSVAVLALIIGGLSAPWYRTTIEITSSRLGEDTFNIYRHPFYIYTSCYGDYCNFAGADPGFHSWSDVFSEYSHQLTLYVILWIIAAVVGVFIAFEVLTLVWASIAVNRDKRKCALAMYLWSPIYAVGVIVLLFIAVLLFPVCVPSTMYNDGQCEIDTSSNYYYESPCDSAFGTWVGNTGGENFGFRGLQLWTTWGPTTAWYCLLTALVVSIVLLPLSIVMALVAVRLSKTDDINVFAPPSFDYYPVDTTGASAQPAVQSFDQYVPGYNPGSFTLN